MPLNRRKFILNHAALATALLPLGATVRAKAVYASGLSEVFKDDFFLGTAISNKTLSGSDPAMFKLIAQEFNTITAENAMKWQSIHPDHERWDWRLADRFVKFGHEANMLMIGHTLIWHKQTPPTVFFKSRKKQDALISRDLLRKRLRLHVQTVIDRYKRQIALWDVVNEAVTDKGRWRESHWYDIMGEEFLEQAFRAAREADPSAHLMYNDFNMEKRQKQRFVIHILNTLRKRGVTVDGVGLQCHVSLAADAPSIDALEAAIINFAKAGLRVHITELDVDVLPNAWKYKGLHIDDLPIDSDPLDPYKNGLPARIEQQLAERYQALFELFIKHRDKIARVSLWGTSDDESWKNDRPVIGRTNHPLLFDTQKRSKKAYDAIYKLKDKRAP